MLVVIVLALPGEAKGQDALAWSWRRQHPADYAGTAAFGLIAAVAEGLPRGPSSWVGGSGFDLAVRDAFMLGSYGDRRVAGRFSDVTMTALLVHRFLVDGALVTWAGHGSPDAAWQMAALDAQALAFTAALTSSMKTAFGRERPSGTACRTDPAYDRRCEEQSADGSFFSGHTSISFATAGLTCLHHAQLPLYGGRGDVIACVAASLAATSVGFERILADRHYASDVLAGAAVGALSGVLLPWLSVYAHPRAGGAVTAWSASPVLAAGGAGLSLGGIF